MHRQRMARRRLLPGGRRADLPASAQASDWDGNLSPDCGCARHWLLATSSVGVGWRFDLDDHTHLLGYVRRGIENTAATDQYSWYASVLFTF